MWQARLRDNYDNNFEQWKAYATTYGLHTRLGFDSPKEAWSANPIIQGSVNPADFKIVESQKQSK